MRHSSFRAILLLIVLASISVLACDLSSLASMGISQASKPTTQIVAPAPNSQFRDGDEVSIQSISIDATGIVRVELTVDGAVVRADAPPVASGQTSFTLIQKWKATAGTHTLSVRAFNVSSTASEPAFITVVVNPAVAEGPTVPIIIPTAIPPLGPTPVLPTIPLSGATAAPSATSTATRAPTRPPSSPTISAPPGVYALSIRVEPSPPKRNQPVLFHVTFLNTTATPQGYRWRIRIFPPDAKNSKGDTAPLDNTIPLGTSTLASSDNWTIRGPGGCEDYFARVFWIDPSSKQETEFVKPDGSGGPAAGFQICP